MLSYGLKEIHFKHGDFIVQNGAFHEWQPLRRALPDFPRHVRGRSSKGVDWLFYFELRNFAAFNNTDKIIYHVSEG